MNIAVIERIAETIAVGNSYNSLLNFSTASFFLLSILSIILPISLRFSRDEIIDKVREAPPDLGYGLVFQTILSGNESVKALMKLVGGYGFVAVLSIIGPFTVSSTYKMMYFTLTRIVTLGVTLYFLYWLGCIALKTHQLYTGLNWLDDERFH